MVTSRAKPVVATRFTRSSTTWMLTGARSTGPLVGKHVHAVDQLDDAVGLGGDELGQRPVVVADRLLQQLGGAADARQRVLDLVGEHGGQAGDRAGGTAMGELPVDLVGHGAFLQHDDGAGLAVDQRRGMDVDDALRADARRGNVDPIAVDRRACGARPRRPAPAPGCRRARNRTGRACAGWQGSPGRRTGPNRSP